MIVRDLYQKVLLDPFQNKGADSLFIVSGYSSATFANRHLSDSSDDVSVNLIIGMPGKRSDHIVYEQLRREFSSRFNAYYLEGSPPVHSKIYGWFKDNDPVIGFAGSANYSQPGFISATQINQFSSEDPLKIRDFYNQLISRSIPIEHAQRPDPVLFDFDDETTVLPHTTTGSVIPGSIIWETPNRRVRISFLGKKGSLPPISGLNWGQRPGREPNQAYLPVRADAKDEGFLPPLAYTFTLLTDDGQFIDCAVAQQGRKAIHSNKNNSEIGRYIRQRIGVPLGYPVLKSDLENYGRTDYTLQKINDETFLLDMSV